MFSVLVLGGIGLVAPACGGSVGSPITVHDCDPLTCPQADASPDAFPSETAELVDGGQGFDAFPSETAEMIDGGQGFDAFPSETDQAFDGGQGFDSAQGVDAFPSEGPAQIDAAPPPPDATTDAFPEETAVALDGGTP
jgi:hypothetical protein